ncbi:hypothetical protein J3R83DRAFT_8928 [Lanmaoa asiatica]|nr:hypothetical protein J3R83DRAFT_8928 [Lanmaoa asiatica]
MPVLITHNLRTDLDITNGTRGTITNIILYPSEPHPSRSQQIIELQQLPLFILVKLERTRAPRFSSEKESVIPISPMKSSIRLRLTQNSKNVVADNFQLRRRMLSLITAPKDRQYLQLSLISPLLRPVN